MKDAGGVMENYDALMREYRVLEQQLELRRRLLEGDGTHGTCPLLSAETLEVRKLLAQAGIGQQEAAQRLGIPGGDLACKLSGERKFKRWERTELTEMAKERLEAEWT